jgi:hypothetical protein
MVLRLCDVAVGFGAVWATYAGSDVVRIDEDDASHVARIELGHRAGGITLGAGAVWVTVQAPIV